MDGSFLRTILASCPGSWTVRRGGASPEIPARPTLLPCSRARSSLSNEAVGLPASGLSTPPFLPSVEKFKTVIFYDVAKAQMGILRKDAGSSRWRSWILHSWFLV